METIMTETATLIALILSAGLIYCVGTVVIYVLTIVAHWRLFTKAGEKGWKSLIPVYNLYILFKIVWSTGAFFRMLIEILIIIVLNVLLQNGMVDPGTNIGMLLGVAMLVLMLSLMIMKLKVIYYTSKSYGHGIGYFFGLLFLNTLFVLILGLGRSAYIGKKKGR